MSKVIATSRSRSMDTLPGLTMALTRSRTLTATDAPRSGAVQRRRDQDHARRPVTMATRPAKS